MNFLRNLAIILLVSSLSAVLANAQADSDGDGFQGPNVPAGCELTTKLDCNDNDKNINYFYRFIVI